MVTRYLSVPLDGPAHRLGVHRGRVADATPEKVVLGTPLEKVVVQGGTCHGLVNINRPLVVPGLRRILGHLEQALIRTRGRVLPRVKISSVLKDKKKKKIKKKEK